MAFYPNKKRSTKRSKRSYRKKPAKRNALAIANKALSLAKKTMMSSTETKYLSRTDDTDLAGSAALFGAAYAFDATDVGTFTARFGTDSVTGNKSYLKYIKGYWDCHMDNVNNEEETVNLTLVVWRPRADFDTLQSVETQVCYSSNGQPFFNPRVVKVLHKKYFTLTMGGTSPGTAGESRKFGQFYIPINRMIRWAVNGAVGASVNPPASFQDRIYISWYTDNSAVDTESPRLNMHTLACYRDVDLNH